MAIEVIPLRKNIGDNQTLHHFVVIGRSDSLVKVQNFDFEIFRISISISEFFFCFMSILALSI
jgi:hypothetical protein